MHRRDHVVSVITECGNELVSGLGHKVKREVFPVHAMKACMGSRDVAVLILNLAQHRHE